MLSSLCNTLLSTTSSKSSREVSSTEPAFLISLFNFLLASVTGSDAAAPTDGCKGNGTCHHRLTKDMQLVADVYLAAHIKGTKLPQEVVCSVPFFRQPQCCISSPVCCQGKHTGWVSLIPPPPQPLFPGWKWCSTLSSFSWNQWPSPLSWCHSRGDGWPHTTTQSGPPGPCTVSPDHCWHARQLHRHQEMSADNKTLSCSESLRCTEEERGEHSPLLCGCATNHLFWHASPQLHKLWSICQEMEDPGSCGGAYLHLLKLLSEQCRLDCVKGTGGIKEHDRQSAVCFVQVRLHLLQQVNDGIFDSNLGANCNVHFHKVQLAGEPVCSHLEQIEVTLGTGTRQDVFSNIRTFSWLWLR